LDRVAGVTSFDELDWAGLVRTIDGLTAERERLTGASGELARLQRLLAEASDRVLRAGEQRDRVLNRMGSTEAEQRRARAEADVRKQAALIDERIDRINDSLHGIDYNHGRYISLETARTPNMEVRTFLADLRACTDSALDGDDADGTYSERKFHQVRALVER